MTEVLLNRGFDLNQKVYFISRFRKNAYGKIDSIFENFNAILKILIENQQKNEGIRFVLSSNSGEREKSRTCILIKICQTIIIQAKNSSH